MASSLSTSLACHAASSLTAQNQWSEEHFVVRKCGHTSFIEEVTNLLRGELVRSQNQKLYREYWKLWLSNWQLLLRRLWQTQNLETWVLIPLIMCVESLLLDVMPYMGKVKWLSVEIVMALEEEFKINIEDNGAETIVTVQDAANLIEKAAASVSS